MAKVIKGEKKLAIIVDQQEYDLITALVGQTNGSGYNVNMWNKLKEHRVLNSDKVIALPGSIVVYNRTHDYGKSD